MLDPRHIAHVLGGKVVGRDRVVAPGPGHSRKDRSLSIKLSAAAPGGFLIYSHAGDDWKECRDFVAARLGLPPWQPGDGQDRRVPSRVEQFDRATVNGEAEKPHTWTEDDVKRINAARRVWAEGKDPRGTLADIYLKQHRRLELPDALAGTVLRFHPACPWRDEDSGQIIRVPALIGAFRQIGDDTITAVQRVRLNPDGGKHGRRMLGVVNRAAVKFDPVGKQLSVGEGIETCLAGRQLGLSPVWALGSVGAISFLPIIENVQRLIILGEAGEASARAIKMCGKRWQQARREVCAAVPDAGFGDLESF